VTSIPVLLITGPLGVGKTTVLDAVADRLRAAHVPFAAVDLDALAWAHPPAPGDDPYRNLLMFRNLASVWRNFRDSGATRLVCAYVVESRDELDRYRAAIPGAAVTVARLRASEDTLERRLSRRLAHSDLVDGQVRLDERARRERRAARSRELAELMDRAKVEDLIVETDGRDVDAIARDVLRLAGWPGA
jgi:adenylylsulfate kinase